MGDYSAQLSSAPGQGLTSASGGLSPAPKSLLVWSLCLPGKLLPQGLLLFLEKKKKKNISTISLKNLNMPSGY